MKKQIRTLTWLLVPLLALILVTGMAVGKYFATISLDGTITFQASLATDVTVQEHIPMRQENGTYILGENTTVEGATYNLIPGLDVPKDPHVVIAGKTAVPAYLYLVVEDQLIAAVSYELDPCWQHLKDNVYVYCVDGNAAVITEDPGIINILQNQTLYVSQTLPAGASGGSLKFTAVLKEIGPGRTAEEVYG